MRFKSFDNTMQKEEIACNEQFVLFTQYPLSFLRFFSHFHQIWNCCLQTLSIWKDLKFTVWEWVKIVTNGSKHIGWVDNIAGGKKTSMVTSISSFPTMFSKAFLTVVGI